MNDGHAAGAHWASVTADVGGPATAHTPAQLRPSGVREVFRYNWPLYVAGTAAALGLGLTTRLPLPRLPAALVRLGALGATGLLVSSTVASWWVYDRSDLHGFDWLEGLLAELGPDGPNDHLVVSTGLDEASVPLAVRYPRSNGRAVDLYDPALTTEGSIRRARRRVPPVPGTVRGTPQRLPVASASQDAVLLVFAAHELRSARDRADLFAECARSLRPDGTLVLVEHLRDVGNAAVFGPGAWHFYPRAEWLRVAAEAGLAVVRERRIGGLVTAFALRAAPNGESAGSTESAACTD